MQNKIEHLPRLVEGDVIFFRSNGRIARIIRKVTRTKGESETWANHEAVIVASVTKQIIEANPSGVELSSLLKYCDGKTEIQIFRHIELKDNVRFSIANKALKKKGERYGFLSIPMQYLDHKFLQGAYVFRRINVPNSEFCSEVVDNLYQDHGYYLGSPRGCATPDCHHDYISKSQFWTKVFEGTLIV